MPLKTLKKLYIKDHNPVLILNAPEAFQPVMDGMDTDIHSTPDGKYGFVMAFAETLKDGTRLAKKCSEAIADDAVLWMCYPKGTSQKYKASDLHRDNCYPLFTLYGLRPVAAVAIDEDWSALRFRKEG